MITAALSIDMDFFTPDDPMWDFGHTEKGDMAEFFLHNVWGIRYRTNPKLMEVSDIGQADFPPADIIRTFAATKGIFFNPRRAAIAESHRHAYKWFARDHHPPAVVLSLDAHHDCFTKTSKLLKSDVACDNWLQWLQLEWACYGVQFVHLTPSWMPDAVERYGPPMAASRKLAPITQQPWAEYFPPEPMEVTSVFLCRSGVWVPPHHDATFRELAGECIRAVRDTHRITGKSEWLEEVPPRDPEFYHDLATKHQQYLDQIKKLDSLMEHTDG